jgi:ketosteroid isomerase-like protein
MTPDDQLTRRLHVLESESAIRRLMADYVEARDSQDGDGHSAAFFTPDAIWEGVGGFKDLLGFHQGREALDRREAASRQRLPFSAHFLTNESITVDGDTAVGRWTFLQCGVADGQALWIAGRYRNDFVRVDGEWKIRHLRVGDIFVAPYADGWAPYVAAKLHPGPA